MLKADGVNATLLFEFTQSDTVNVVAMEGNRLAAGGSNRQVLVYDIGCGLLLHTFNLKETVNTISMCGDLLAAGACHTPAESPLSGRITSVGCARLAESLRFRCFHGERL